MCGGFKIESKKIPREELSKYYPAEQVEKIIKDSFFESHFWDKQPLLPYIQNNQIHLLDWGNRDKEIHLPQTGWAKKESIEKGRWKWLHPQIVDLPIEKGVEKKVWFDLPEGTKGLLVERDLIKKIYMITEEADEIYLKNTKHNRMPVGLKKNFLGLLF